MISMTHSHRPRRGVLLAAVFLLAGSLSVLFFGDADLATWSGRPQDSRTPTGGPQLVSVEPWMTQSADGPEGMMCQWVPASASAPISLAQEPAPVEAGKRGADLDRPPVRVIRDSYPTYSAVALDLQTDDVYLQDENLFGLKVFDRLDNTPPTAAFTEPKRVLGGIDTKLEFNCALYVDPKSGDVYSVNNDTVDHMVVFPRGAKGNMKPMRMLRTPHGSFGVAVDEVNQELSLTVEHDHAVVTYRKNAKDDDPPIRLLQGDHTLLADPHGIAVDPKAGLLFVANHGSRYTPTGERPAGMPEHWPQGRDTGRLPGSGNFLPPSITVYPLGASGDTPPIRVIRGPKTMLNWPATLYVDEKHGELYVANDAGDSILVFDIHADGNAAPARAIHGPSTGLKYPTGVFVDLEHDELWVSNMGNHSATVYRRTADGNAAPLRTIRSAPAGKLALAIGNPGAAEYDTRRDEILVPN